MLLECLEIALQAPTGSNSQGWQWMFVEDPAKKQAIADYYGASFDRLPPAAPSARVPARATSERSTATRVTSSADYLSEHFHEVPVMLIPLIEGRLDGVPVVHGAGCVGLDPARGVELHAGTAQRGLGSAWTTLHLSDEREVADLLGIPFDRYTQAGLFPIAYTSAPTSSPRRASRPPNSSTSTRW